MRILYVAFDDIDRRFAGTVHIREIVSRLRESGETVAIASPRRPSSTPEKWVGEWHEIPIHGGWIGKQWRYLFGSLFALLRIVRSFRPDILYCRGSHLNLAIPACAILTGTPLVTEINGLIEEEVSGAALKFTARTFQYLHLLASKSIVTVSRLLQGVIVRRYGLPPSKVVVIPNGADPKLFRPIDRDSLRRRIGLRPEAFVIVYAGSFYRGHGLNLFIDAVTMLVKERRLDIQALLIGGGVDHERISKSVDVAGMSDRVLFTGEIDREEVAKYISCADGGMLFTKGTRYVLASSPFKMFEYMAAAIPVIAVVHSMEVAEFIGQSAVGRVAIYSPSRRDNVDALARMIGELVDSPDLRRQMGARGRQLVEEFYNWSRAARDVAAVIHAASRKS